MQTIILVLKIGNSKITESLLNRKAVTVLVTHQSYSGLQRFFSRGSTKLRNSGNSRGWGLKQKLPSVMRIALRNEAGYGYFLGLHNVTDRIDPRIDPKMKWLEGNRSNLKCCSFQFGVNNERDFLFFYGLLLFEKQRSAARLRLLTP